MQTDVVATPSAREKTFIRRSKPVFLAVTQIFVWQHRQSSKPKLGLFDGYRWSGIFHIYLSQTFSSFLGIARTYLIKNFREK